MSRSSKTQPMSNNLLPGLQLPHWLDWGTALIERFFRKGETVPCISAELHIGTQELQDALDRLNELGKFKVRGRLKESSFSPIRYPAPPLGAHFREAENIAAVIDHLMRTRPDRVRDMTEWGVKNVRKEGRILLLGSLRKRPQEYQKRCSEIATFLAHVRSYKPLKIQTFFEGYEVGGVKPNLIQHLKDTGMSARTVIHTVHARHRVSKSQLENLGFLVSTSADQKVTKRIVLQENGEKAAAVKDASSDTFWYVQIVAYMTTAWKQELPRFEAREQRVREMSAWSQQAVLPASGHTQAGAPEDRMRTPD
jgi:hypothetical protein